MRCAPCARGNTACSAHTHTHTLAHSYAHAATRTQPRAPPAHAPSRGGPPPSSASHAGAVAPGRLSLLVTKLCSSASVVSGATAAAASIQDLVRCHARPLRADWTCDTLRGAGGGGGAKVRVRRGQEVAKAHPE
jgi:hypothetical protein